jgi:hypothetical protein
MKDLQIELEKRGTAEVSSDGIVNQVTQALDESDTKVKLLIFGELQEKVIIPIAQACGKCESWKGYGDKSIQNCQSRQKKDAQARGFRKLICPKQFVD